MFESLKSHHSSWSQSKVNPDNFRWPFFMCFFILFFLVSEINIRTSIYILDGQIRRSPHLPQVEGGWQWAGFGPEMIKTIKQQYEVHTTWPGIIRTLEKSTKIIITKHNFFKEMNKAYFSCIFLLSFFLSDNFFHSFSPVPSILYLFYFVRFYFDRKKKHKYLSRDNSDTSSVDFSGARVAQTSSGHVISEDPKGDRLAAAYNPTFNWSLE